MGHRWTREIYSVGREVLQNGSYFSCSTYDFAFVALSQVISLDKKAGKKFYQMHTKVKMLLTYFTTNYFLTVLTSSTGTKVSLGEDNRPPGPQAVA